LEIVVNFTRVTCILEVGLMEILNSKLRYNFSWESYTRQNQEDSVVQYSLVTAHSFYVGICSYYTYTYIYTGCFTTLGHNCRRWFPRPLWWKKFI